MNGWLMLALYWFGFFVLARIAYVKVADDYDERPRTSNEPPAEALSLMAGVIWPLIALVASCKWVFKHAVFRPTRKQRAAKKRAEQAKLMKMVDEAGFSDVTRLTLLSDLNPERTYDILTDRNDKP